MEKSRRKSKGLKGYYIAIVIVIVLFIAGYGITYLALKNNQSKPTTNNKVTETEQVTVPKVVGLTQKEAIQKLENANLKYQVIEETSKIIEKGYIIKQSIDNGKTVDKDTTITITVSKGTGIEQVTVPKVIALSQEQAIQELENANLKYTVIEETSKTVEKGYIMKQSIDKGKTVDKGTTVTITVSKGI